VCGETVQPLVSTAPRVSAARALWFASARRAEVRDETVPPPSGNQVTVRAIASLVSAGTEMLIYRGEGAQGDDLGLETCVGSFSFPVKYAYQVVGEVIDAGAEARYPVGRRVFCRHPHQSYFTMRSDNWLMAQVPDGLEPERAVFVNLLEVAVNCMLDVPVRVGDVAVVYGQGVVGSLLAQLARRTAGKLIVVDPFPSRRESALGWGADAAIDPSEARPVIDELSEGRGADVSIEASGAPAALQSAIDTTGQEGTIAAVSFYGTKVVPLTLAPEFHYRRHHIVSSQVSTIGSGLQPRWSFERRTATGFALLATPWLVTPVSHRLPFERAPGAYRLLDEHPEQAMGIVLDYTA
jgi:2-desacetyl-2-hydroxyethyl bacteriochlorophyllide A dehydrogenase